MNALFFLLRKEAKNSLLDLLRHPVKLVAYILLFGMLGFSIFQRAVMHWGVPPVTADIRLLHGVYFGALLLLGVPILLSGMKSGAAFFKMNDVNLLFPAPVSPRKILLYGLLRQLASILLLTIFLLLYGVMAMDMFGVTWGEILILVLGLVVGLFQFEVLAMLAYQLANRNPRWVQRMRGALYVVLAAAAMGVLYGFSLGKGGPDSVLSAISVSVLEALPVFGWVKGLVFGLISGNILNVFIYGILVATTIFGALLIFLKGNVDYYESVIDRAEAGYEQHETESVGHAARRHGRARVSAMGIGAGWGASVFFFKHLREGKRRSRLVFAGMSTLLLLGVNLVLIFLLSYASSAGPLRPDYLMGVSLTLSCYILFFYSTTGDWVRELANPYIYLAPEAPFRKLLWAGAAGVAKACAEGVLLFTVMGIFTGCSPLTAVACMLVYAAMGVFFLAGNVLSVRLFGKVAGRACCCLS
ncbi:MAG: putative ABC exporter domain-containing protein [Hydrogeniiclostridium mannosilyticum]